MPVGLGAEQGVDQSEFALSDAEKLRSLYKMFSPPREEGNYRLKRMTDRFRDTIRNHESWKKMDYEKAATLISRAQVTGALTTGAINYPQVEFRAEDGAIVFSSLKANHELVTVVVRPVEGKIITEFYKDFILPSLPTELQGLDAISDLVKEATGVNLELRQNILYSRKSLVSTKHVQRLSTSCPLEGKTNNAFNLLTAFGLTGAALESALFTTQERISDMTAYPRNGESSYEYDGLDLGLHVGELTEEQVKMYLEQPINRLDQFYISERANAKIGVDENGKPYILPVVMDGKVNFGRQPTDWEGDETTLTDEIPDLSIDKLNIFAGNQDRKNGINGVEIELSHPVDFSFYFYDSRGGEYLEKDFWPGNLWRQNDLRPRITKIFDEREIGKGKNAGTHTKSGEKPTGFPENRSSEPQIHWTRDEALKYLSITLADFEAVTGRARTHLVDKARRRVGVQFHPDANLDNQDSAHTISIEINKAADYLIKNYC